MNIIKYLAILNKDKLSDSDREILVSLEDVIERIPNSTLSELSKLVYTSNSTLFRIVKKLGFKSFTEFKFKISQNIKSNPDLSESYEENNFLNIIAESLEITDIEINEVVKECALQILAHDNLYIYGTGYKQQRLSESFSSDLRLYGVDFNNLRSLDELEIIKNNEKNLLIVLSYQGNVQNFSSFLTQLKESNTKIIGISSNDKSYLSDISDYNLYYLEYDFGTDNKHWTVFSMYYVLEKLIYEISNEIDNQYKSKNC